MERWRNRVALITGASSGIGLAVAEALARTGMKVAVAARRRDRLEALVARLGEGGAEALSIVADLRDEASILSMFARVRERWDGVDVLVNNAGLGHRAALLDGETEKWREMLEVNVLALCVCTREGVADMRQRGDDGHVIHISSMAAHRVPLGSGVYAATKYAVRSLTEGLRGELRQAKSRIRVSAVSPGYVETEFAENYHQSAEQAREIYSRFPIIQPRDIASTVLHILGQPPNVQIHDVLMRPTDDPV